MTADLPLLVLFAGVFALLAAATVVTEAVAQRRPGPVTQNLRARVAAWWVMVVLLALAFAFGRTGVVMLFALVSFAALREVFTLTVRGTADHLALAAGFFVVLPAQYVLVWTDWYGLYSILIPVYAFLFLPVISALRGGPAGFLDRVAETQWALMLCVYCISHVPALLYLAIPGFEGRGVLLIAWLIFTVQFSDVMQYVWGKLAGRRPVAPALSPSKTWEGFLGGIATAAAAGTGLWWLTPFGPLQAGLLALMVTVMGACGGLVLSAVKRDRGVKDWGHLIGGHGGVIDRLDSVIFAAPLFFHVVRWMWSTT
ncbi:MAG: phosphatidate cytidylyltransferase [Rhodobacteraceae bacterium]|jgi:phosphatidate cytidylyltransferase|nr:phosphatidate cytidylyltransferase [Paracoccaceae bacterium]